jgi:hypothetical protein
VHRRVKRRDGARRSRRCANQRNEGGGRLDQSVGTAKRAAEALALNPKYIGAVAFQCTGEPDTGEFGDAEVMGKFGATPNDLSAL